MCYLDDPLLFHSTLEQHIAGLQCMLDGIRQFGLKAQPKKIEICSRRGEFPEVYKMELVYGTGI